MAQCLQITQKSLLIRGIIVLLTLRPKNLEMIVLPEIKLNLKKTPLKCFNCLLGESCFFTVGRSLFTFISLFLFVGYLFTFVSGLFTFVNYLFTLTSHFFLHFSAICLLLSVCLLLTTIFIAVCLHFEFLIWNVFF